MKSSGPYPRVPVEGGGRGAQAGSVLLVETVRKSGLGGATPPAHRTCPARLVTALVLGA